MTKEVKRPKRLTLGDFPRDRSGALSGLRSALTGTFNLCRQYPAKMAMLKETIRFVFNKIKAWEEEVAEEKEAHAKNRLELEARAIGLELDSRKTLEHMQEDYDEEVAEQAAEALKAQSNQSDTSTDNSQGIVPEEPEQPKLLGIDPALEGSEKTVQGEVVQGVVTDVKTEVTKEVKTDALKDVVKETK